MAICMSNFGLDISSKYLVVEECIGNFVFSGQKFQCNARKLVEYLQSNFLNVGAMIFQNTQLYPACMFMHECYHIAEHVSCMFCFAWRIQSSSQSWLMQLYSYLWMVYYKRKYKGGYIYPSTNTISCFAGQIVIMYFQHANWFFI